MKPCFKPNELNFVDLPGCWVSICQGVAVAVLIGIFKATQTNDTPVSNCYER